MDLIKSILDQLSGENIERLSTQMGTDPKTTQSVANAAIPTILSSLAGLAASEVGAKKLTSTLGGLDLGKLGNITSMLDSEPGAMAQKGSGLLSSLFGDSVVSNIASSIGSYVGLDSGLVKRITTFLTPLVLGKVAAAWQSKGGTASALQGLFAEQKTNIAHALPTGFSLASIPGLPSAEATVRGMTNAASAAGRAANEAGRRAANTAQNASSSLLSWGVPLATLALAAAGLWYFFGRGAAEKIAQDSKTAADNATEGARKDVDRAATDTANAASKTVTAFKPTLPDLPLPDTSKVTTDLNGVVSSATQSLAGIRDVASAEAALPQLTELSTKIDGIRGVLDKLPAAGQVALGKVIEKHFGSIQEQATKIAGMPGVGDQVKSVAEGITNKLAGLNLAKVSADTQSIFTTLTNTLNGVKDASSAESAQLQLKEVAGKIDELKRVQTQMSPGGQSMLAKLISTARGPLEQLVAKVLSTLGADAVAVKPMLDEILGKLTGLTQTTI